MAKKGGLGAGLDALIPQKAEKELAKTNNGARKKAPTKQTEKVSSDKKETLIKINEVEPNREQPRKAFDQAALKELAASIREHGVLQPLLVVEKDGYYQIIAGERRWRAAKMAGLKEIPVIIKELSEQEIVEIALIENIQREDLNPIEEALAYKKLIEDFGLKQGDVAKRVAKSRTAVTNTMRLLKLDEEVQKVLVKGSISMGHARALLGLEDSIMQREAAEQVVEQALSVRETESLVKGMLHPKRTRTVTPLTPEMEHLYRDLENQLKDVLGTKVEIKTRGSKGRIEISYFSQDELETLLQMLKSMDRGL